MEQFTIRDIENLTGIKNHVLRMWEQRHPIFASGQTQSKRRVYTSEQLKKWLQISILYESGYKASHLTALSSDEIFEKAKSISVAPTSYRLFVLQLIEVLLNFDERQFTNRLDGLTGIMGFENCIAKVCDPLLKRVLSLRTANQTISAQEHFAKNIILKKIIAKTDDFTLQDQGPVIVLFSPEGEHYELALLFIHYLLKKSGWNTVYLGGQVPLTTLRQLETVASIQYIYVHFVVSFTGLMLDDYMETLHDDFPNVKLIASGIAVSTLQRQFVHLAILKTDVEIHEFIKKGGK